MMLSHLQEGTAIRLAAPSDAAAIAEIYHHYIKETVVTFEEEPVTAEEITRRIEEVRSASLPWLVVEEGGHVVGYAYARAGGPEVRIAFPSRSRSMSPPDARGAGSAPNCTGSSSRFFRPVVFTR